MSDNDYVCDLIIDAVVEWLGRRYRKSQIKLELAKINGGKRLNPWVVEKLITLARQKIRDRYHTDPMDFKGDAIEFYEQIIRAERASLKYKLKAQQRLDVLLGLEHLSVEDPSIYAAKIVEAMAAMDDSVKGIPEKEEEKQKESQDEEANQSDSSIANSTDEIKDDELKDALKDVPLTDDGCSLKNKDEDG